MEFADIHSHALLGGDDGAQDGGEMFGMVDRAYADGVRYLCLTPHFHPGYFGENRNQTERAYSLLRQAVPERYPGLRLALGNELRYDAGCVAWLRDGRCRTLGGTSYVLVDFARDEEAREICRGLKALLSAGYVPVLAHAERYVRLGMKELTGLWENGVQLQLDAQALLGRMGFFARHRCRAILRAGLASYIGSDAHDTTRRPPEISAAYAEVRRLTDPGTAAALCLENARERFFQDQTAE